MTSSAHEKSIIETCEKSITVNVRSCASSSNRSIWSRTAAPVGRVTRFERTSVAELAEFHALES